MFVFLVIHPCALYSDNLLDEKQEIISYYRKQETGNYYYFGLILMQVLYLVGILLMTFDLLTCGHSKEGNAQKEIYVSYYSGTSLKWTPLGAKN